MATNEMPFKLYTSNRLENLADALAEALRQPLASPLAPEQIMVQSRGMERWLSMHLANKLGVCANVNFPFPNAFVRQIMQPGETETTTAPTAVNSGAALPEDEADPFSPAVLTWRLMRILPALLDQPQFAQLKAYLQEPDKNLKRLQLCSRIADLFDQYGVYRPEMVLSWDSGKDNQWQAELWRQTSHERPKQHRAELQKQFLERLQQEDHPDLPQRLSVFGISTLPEFHIQVLEAISSRCNVCLFLLNPCKEFWGDIVSKSEIRRIQKQQQKSSGTLDLFAPVDRGNTLLASMGTVGRDFFFMVEQHDYEQFELFATPNQNSLLGSLQSDLLNLEDRILTGEAKNKIAEDDHSIQFHACYSERREIEVLQDQLLDLFQNDPTLKPADVLVMAPDIEPYVPFIQAVFDLPFRDRRRLPFSIADRTYRTDSEVISAFFALLDLHRSRFEAATVLSLLESPSVSRQFGIDEEQLELIHHWVRETRIRWGRDAGDREALGLPRIHENTWQAGLDRLLLGYALPGDGDEIFADDIVPYGEVEGGQAATLGKLAEFLERLTKVTSEMQRPRSLADWHTTLEQALDSLFASTDENYADVQILRRALRSLSEIATQAGFKEKVELKLVQHFLTAQLQRAGHGFGFLTGGITFCSMLPMRSIPARVLCLIGMNSDAYPRQNKRPGFDLIAQNPRRGDRSRRQDDRYLFLEALLSARNKLYISYVGQSIKDNTVVPPSVLVSELRAYLDGNFKMANGDDLLEKLTAQHRLQAFSPSYFDGTSDLFSYSAENLAAAQSLTQAERTLPPPFFAQKLVEPDDTFRTVSLLDLYRFFRNPARFLLNRRLGMYLHDEKAMLEDTENFSLFGLDRYSVGQRLVAAHTAGESPEKLDQLKSAQLTSGQLPHAAVGLCEIDLLDDKTRNFAAFVGNHVKSEPSQPLLFEHQFGSFLVKGKLDNLHKDGLVIYRYATLRAKDYLLGWLNHLALQLARPGQQSESFLLGLKDAASGDCCGWHFQPIAEAEQIMSGLLDLYWLGLHQPLRFFPDSALTYARRMQGKRDTADWALKKARDVWASGKRDSGEPIRGENDDPYFGCCFRHEADALNEEFREIALAVFEPILTNGRALN